MKNIDNSAFTQNTYPPPSDLPPPPPTPTHSQNHLPPLPFPKPTDPLMFFYQNNFSNQENPPCLPPPPGLPQGMRYLHQASMPTYSLTGFENYNMQNRGWQKNTAIPVPSNSYFINRNHDEIRYSEAELRAMATTLIVDHAPTTTKYFPSTSVKAESHKKANGRSNKNVAWGLDEHYMYLEGVRKFGHGKWKRISEMMGNVKTPAQIASHAQKHNIRKNTPHVLRKRRTINDIDELNCTDFMTGVLNPLKTFPESVKSPCQATEKSTVCDASPPIGVPSPTSFESLNSAAEVDSYLGEGGDDKTKGVITEMVADSSSCMPSIDDVGYDKPGMSSNFLYLSGFEGEDCDMVDDVRVGNCWESLFTEGDSEIVSQQPMLLENRMTMESWAYLPSLSLEEKDWWN